MNIKLLKELYKQAETECGWSEGKFAQLIIRECKDLLFESSENNRLPIAVDDMVHIIDTHFGVEQ